MSLPRKKLRRRESFTAGAFGKKPKVPETRIPVSPSDTHVPTKRRAAFTHFRPNVRSRHPSHAEFRQSIGRLPFRSLVRFGSTTVLNDGIDRIECNSVAGVRNSSDKYKMKLAFTRAGVQTAEWWIYTPGSGQQNFSQVTGVTNNGEPVTTTNPIPVPCVTKHRMGSRGRGNSLISTQEALSQWLTAHQGRLDEYIIEKFHDFNREYRLHMTEERCFYTCRKVLKTDTPENDRWRRHEDNCAWLVEENPKFDRPRNWEAIVENCKNALRALGLDVAAFDVKVQTARSAKGTVRETPKFILLESNSAPSFGEITTEKYLTEIPRLLRRKFQAVR